MRRIIPALVLLLASVATSFAFDDSTTCYRIKGASFGDVMMNKYAGGVWGTIQYRPTDIEACLEPMELKGYWRLSVRTPSGGFGEYRMPIAPSAVGTFTLIRGNLDAIITIEKS